MPGSNAFDGLDLATLTTLQTAYVAAIVALAANQSYSLNGRSLNRANLPDVRDTLGQINAAIASISETSTNVTCVSFTGL